MDQNAQIMETRKTVNSTHYSANLQVSLYSNHCSNFYSGNNGTNNESTNHISCLLAWYLYYNFGLNRTWDVVLVEHSLGGIIIRRALQFVQQHDSHFPSNTGNVKDVVTFMSPHGGVIGGTIACGGCVEGNELNNGSNLMNDMAVNAKHPNVGAGGTDWTVIGSNCDLLTGGQALEMSANHFVWYAYYPTCYNHGDAIHDESYTTDGEAWSCDVPDPASTNCPVNGWDSPTGSTSWAFDSQYPHGLYELLFAITYFSW